MRPEFIFSEHQLDAASRMFNGCILNGNVGSGKSRTALYYYFTSHGGEIDHEHYKAMDSPKPLYIITTAAKRDKLEWEQELVPFLLDATIDSWNNITKYKDVKNAFFIFDEDRVTGYGTWAKTFIQITKSNEWIILSATPGDKWEDYLAVFIAHGFYRTKTEFSNEHLIYDNRCTKYRKVKGYWNVGRLIRLRNNILIDIEDMRHTTQHHEDIFCDYDHVLHRTILKDRWNPFESRPVRDVAEACRLLRQLVNSSEDRQVKLLELLDTHGRAIIFYNFDFEREILLHLGYVPGTDIAEWSGHAHQPIPEGDRWVYLVQYTAGCEGWNSIKTDTVIFYSQSYSYRQTIQAAGRIDRMNTPFQDLYYYHLKSRSGIDLAISKTLAQKKNFNENRYIKDWGGAKFATS